MKLETIEANTNLLLHSPLFHKEKKSVSLSKEEKEKIRQESEIKQKEASAFINKLKLEKQERIHQKEEQQKQLEIKAKIEEETQRKEAQKREEEMLQKHKSEIAHYYESLREKRENEHQIIKQHQKRQALSPEGSYLYHKLEERYKQEVLLPMLEDRKKELALKRNQLRPLDGKEFEDHMRKYELKKAEDIQRRKKELKEKKMMDGEFQERLKQYHTEISDKALVLENEKKIQEQERQQQARAFRDKLEHYSSLVKEICPVHPNEEKALELQNKINKLKHPVRQQRDTRKDYQPSIIGRSKLHTSSEEKMANCNLEREKKLRHSSNCASTKARSETSAPQPIPPLPDKKCDYLLELRRKRAENYSASKSLKYNWMSDLKNKHLSQTEKYKILTSKAELIEEDARMKEKLLHAKGGTEKNLEMGDYISDMYLDAVKAKLALLDNL